MSRRGRRRAYDDEPDADGWTRGFEMVLNIPGAPGDSELEGHQQWIKLLAWSWGCSRGDSDAKKPARILSAIAAKKKAIVSQAVKALKQSKQADKKKGKQGDATGTVTDNAAEAEKKSESVEQQSKQANDTAQHGGAAAAAAPAAEDTDAEDAVNEQEVAEEALADYDSDNDGDNQFDESEVKPRSRTKPNMQSLSMTKYVDIASPLVMLKCLSRESAFDCTLRICKRREVKKPKPVDEDTDTKLSAVSAADKPSETARQLSSADEKSGEDAEAKEEKKEYESVVVQEFLLQDCFVVSVSTGGSGGEDRLTENITLSFSRVVFTYTDHLGDAPRARGEIPTKTVYYDSLRRKAMELDQVVAKAIDEQRKLAPVSTVLLDYLNLRSKPAK